MGKPQYFKHWFVLRDGVHEFIKKLSSVANLLVNTKGRIEYALALLDIIDPEEKYGLKANLKAVTENDLVNNKDKEQK